MEKEMTEVAMQNRRLADPLQKAREEMNDMQKKLGGYERDKQILVVGFRCIPSPPWCEGAGRSGRCLPSPRVELAFGAPREVLNPSVPCLVTSWGHVGLAPVLGARWPLAAMVGLGPLCPGAIRSDDHLTCLSLLSRILWVLELGVLSDPSLQCTKARLKVTEKELKSLRWEHEVLEQRFIKVGSRLSGGLLAYLGGSWHVWGAPGCLGASWGIWEALGCLGASWGVWGLPACLGAPRVSEGLPVHLGGSRCIWGLPGHLGGSCCVWWLPGHLEDSWHV